MRTRGRALCAGPGEGEAAGFHRLTAEAPHSRPPSPRQPQCCARAGLALTSGYPRAVRLGLLNPRTFRYLNCGWPKERSELEPEGEQLGEEVCQAGGVGAGGPPLQGRERRAPCWLQGPPGTSESLGQNGGGSLVPGGWLDSPQCRCHPLAKEGTGLPGCAPCSAPAPSFGSAMGKKAPVAAQKGPGLAPPGSGEALLLLPLSLGGSEKWCRR